MELELQERRRFERLRALEVEKIRVQQEEEAQQALRQQFQQESQGFKRSDVIKRIKMY